MTQNDSNKRDARSSAAMWRTVAELTSISFLFFACVVIGVGVGYWLDKKWGTEPWLTVVGGLLGTIAGFLESYRMIQMSRSRKK